jgi:uncharacterized protein YecE (DUF72 family)
VPQTRAQTRVGISGWTYTPWRKVFYPEDLPHKRELAYAATQFNSIEINGSFYSLQTPKSYAHWHDQTPDDFVFAVKGGRYITHMKRLTNIEAPLANFFASGILRLKSKLGPLLWQLPPSMRFDEPKLDAFFSLLPRDTKSAARLARGHDARMKGRSWTRADAERPVRHAVEVRHKSFEDPAFVRLLRRHRVALVFADTAGKWPYFEDVTADFLYLRLHGDEQLYVSGYTDKALDWWAARIRAWCAGAEPPDAKRVGPKPAPKRKSRDVYVYFDNDVKVRAPFDASNLAARLGLATSTPVEMPAVVAAGAAGDEPRQRWPAAYRRAAGGRIPGKA